MKLKLITSLLISCFLMVGTLSAQTEDQTNQVNPADSYQSEASEQHEGVVFTHGQRRESMPFQIQLVQTFGPATPYSFAPGGGIHVGYQMTKSVYIGYTVSAFADGRNAWDDYHNYNYRDDDDKDYNDGEIFGQDGADVTKSELDPMHLLEVRLTPWDFGLYFSIGAMYRGEQKSTTEFRSEARTIGDNKYTTGLKATVDYKEWYGASTGIGFNYIFNNGITLGTAMVWGLNAQTPDVTVSSTASVSQADLDYWKRQIQYNERQLPYLFSFAVGYAF